MKKQLPLTLIVLVLSAVALRAQDLIAHFPLNGSGENLATTDDATLESNATFVENRFGMAGNALHGAATAPLDVYSPEVTIAYWVNPTSLPASGEVYLLSHGGWQERWKISMPGHGKPVFTTNPGSCCNDMDSGDGNELTVGEWTHVTMVHGNDMDKIYVNGVLVNERDAAGELPATVHPLGIGWNPIDMANYFDGALDDVMIWDGALDATAISDLYAQQSMPPVFTSNLVAHYAFNNNGLDDSDYENPLMQNVLLAPDRFGRANKAANFTGTNGLTAANSPQLNSETTTVAFWVNPAMLPVTGEYYLLSHGGWQQRWKISMPGHGKPVWTTNAESGISDMDSGDGNALMPGTWTHVTMVHDGSMDMIYFNGALVASKEVAGPLNSTDMMLGIGFDPSGNANYFVGQLDEVMIFDEALDAAAIAELYDMQAQEPMDSDTEAPTAPGDLAADVVFTSVGLSWSASTDNVGVIAYNVYQDGELIWTTAGTAYTIAELTPETQYTFGVTAVDDAGNESMMTTLDVTSGMEENPDITPPSAPGNLSGNPSFNSVLLSWEASTDDETGVMGYAILVDGEIADSVGANTLSYLAGGLEPETAYTFEVYAYDMNGNDSDISEITVNTTAPLTTAEPGLVAHYPFEGNAEDATPYNNHGNVGGDVVFEESTHAHGGMMNAKFDGDRDSILVPNAVQLLSDYTTVSFWARVDGQNLDDAEAYIMDFGHWDQRWKISLPQHLKPVWTTNSQTDQFDSLISDMDSGDGNELVIGFWFYVTMVHDGENDVIYVNGIQTNSKPAPGELNTTNRAFGIGNNNVNGGQYFQGGLDEIKIYNRALSAEEALQLYNEGRLVGIKEPNLADVYVQSVFPNPTTETLTIEHALPAGETVWIRIFDVQGRQLGHHRLTVSELASGQFQIDVRQLPEGQYLLNFLRGGANSGTVPFSVQR